MNKSENMLDSCNYSVFYKLKTGDPKQLRRLYRMVARSPVYERAECWREVLEEVRSAVGSLSSEMGVLHGDNQAIQRDATLSMVSLVDEQYPSSLHALDQPPLLLYTRTSASALPEEQNCVAIIGSRKADHEGIGIAKWFARELTLRGFTIISGLAYGADAASHWGALSAAAGASNNFHMPTIGVLGSGLHSIYPRAHERLAAEILHSGGALVSEYDLTCGPRRHHFLERNRIIAALARVVIVVQAGKRSGTLSTARHALDLGKDVYVVPGSVRNPLYEGANTLIADGAIPVTTPKRLFEELGVSEKENSALATNATATTVAKEAQSQQALQNEILSFLATYGPTPLSHIQKRWNEDGINVELLLNELVVTEKVRKLSRSRYSLG